MKYYEVTFRIEVQEQLQPQSQQLLQTAVDLTSALAGEAGFETFEETSDGGLTGYIQSSLFNRDLLDQLLTGFPLEGVSVSYTLQEAPDKDWNEEWEEAGFEPIIIGKKCVVHDGRHLGSCCLDDYEMQVQIEARQAFGTGNHETTRLMVEALLNRNLSGQRMLDCGTGTGILAIVALKQGARQAVGYDIDDWSVRNAIHNAKLNGVDDRMEVHLGDSSVLGETVTGPFDVVTANINRNILLADLPRFAACLAPDGLLLLSGFYESDIQKLTDEAVKWGLQLSGRTTECGWACLQLLKNEK